VLSSKAKFSDSTTLNFFFSSSTVETRNFIVFCYVCYNKVVAITADVIADKIIDMSTVYIRLLYI
jgi:hypothetical protein